MNKEIFFAGIEGTGLPPGWYWHYPGETFDKSRGPFKDKGDIT